MGLKNYMDPTDRSCLPLRSGERLIIILVPTHGTYVTHYSQIRSFDNANYNFALFFYYLLAVLIDWTYHLTKAISSSRRSL